MPGTTALEYLALCAVEERSGDWLGAHDVATRGLAEFPDDVGLQHRAVLALARSGATTRAAEVYAALGLGRHAGEDVAALGARIAKDVALAAPRAERPARAREAAEAYRAVFARTRGYYPAVNAATMFLLAGELDAARELGREALDRSGPDGDDYWILATALEAALVLGDDAFFAAHVSKTRSLAGDDHGALGTTLRQLELVCAARGVDPAVLAPLRPPSVIYYSGHRAGRLPAAAEPEVAARIAALLAERGVGYGFGALASGADILFAEALLARGAELHVVLPLQAAAFVAASVGEAWQARFQRCLDAARSVRIVGDGEPDDVLFVYGAQVAMGLAVLRARFLHTEARLLAVWDGQTAAGGAGTAHGVAIWRARGLPVDVIAPGPVEAEAAGPGPSPRSVRALLFGDVKGYSKLVEAQVPVFVTEVMGQLGRVLDDQGDDVLLRASWGDGIYVVMTGAPAAARCALALQHAMRDLDLARLSLPTHCALRLAAHVGPVHHCWDGVSKSEVFCGTHVTQAARIEPITPEGEVYVTEAFAAVLALEDAAFACDYVGDVPTAKGYGSLRMHLLRRTAT